MVRRGSVVVLGSDRPTFDTRDGAGTVLQFWCALDDDDGAEFTGDVVGKGCEWRVSCDVTREEHEPE